MPRSPLIASVLAVLLAGGCAFLRPPIGNPEGLPPQAQTLRYVLDRGCFAYMLDGKPEAEAMKSLRLTHHNPWPGFIMPPGPAFWSGSYPGLSNVVVGRDSCSVNMRGRDADAYRVATELVLRRRFGPAGGPDPAYPQIVPGQRTGCQGGLRYAYYPHRADFSVELNRIADCTKDPARDYRPPVGLPRN